MTTVQLVAGSRLSAACRYSQVSAYLGDDGKVYLA